MYNAHQPNLIAVQIFGNCADRSQIQNESEWNSSGPFSYRNRTQTANISIHFAAALMSEFFDIFQAARLIFHLCAI